MPLPRRRAYSQKHGAVVTPQAANYHLSGLRKAGVVDQMRRFLRDSPHASAVRPLVFDGNMVAAPNPTLNTYQPKRL